MVSLTEPEVAGSGPQAKHNKQINLYNTSGKTRQVKENTQFLSLFLSRLKIHILWVIVVQSII